MSQKTTFGENPSGSLHLVFSRKHIHVTPTTSSLSSTKQMRINERSKLQGTSTELIYYYILKIHNYLRTVIFHFSISSGPPPKFKGRARYRIAQGSTSFHAVRKFRLFRKLKCLSIFIMVLIRVFLNCNHVGSVCWTQID